MDIPLSKLMEDISRSVQNSNFLLEQMAANMYLQSGYQRDPSGAEAGSTSAGKEDLLTPVTYSLQVPTGGKEKEIKVPATALMHHSTMQLEEVDVSLRFRVSGRSEDQGVLVDVRPKLLENSDKISEMKLRFQRDSAPEGISRIETHHYQNLS